jgi:hypothetical protein
MCGNHQVVPNEFEIEIAYWLDMLAFKFQACGVDSEGKGTIV